MVHPVINDHLNCYLVEVFNYNAFELLPDIVTELRFIAYTSSLEQKTTTPEIMIAGDILEIGERIHD